MKSQKIRYTVQAIFLILILLISFNHLVAEKGWSFLPSNPNLHAICPLGGIATLYSMITQDIIVKKLHTSNIVLMWSVIAMGIFLGAAFCGWICPFGTVQEYIGRLGRKIFKKRYNKFIPKKIKPFLQAFRYIFLAIILYKTVETGKLFFAPYDPYHTLFNIWSDELSIISFVILGITILAGLIEERAWCKYACPLGAINGLFNKISIFKIHRNEKQCLDCGICNRECPMDIDVDNKSKITSSICVRCGKCVSICPAKSDTLEYQVGKFNEVSE
ncbi:MAG: 4Fe-4S binding protein [Halanaerobiales bacterium]|nr:4Fe-4S binding protein [Halanaerobiales bacterium]